MTPKQTLESRYIYNEAIAAGWVETLNFWQYPVISANNETVAERLKKYPHSTLKGFKYGWKNGKPDNIESQWYILPKGYKAIRETGVMYIVNGEPSVLACHAGGVDNVGSTTLSEVATPKDGVNSLKNYGVSRVLYLADKDAAGLKSACNWRDALAGSGIDFEALQWPSEMPEKTDANDVLIAVAGDKLKFQAILQNLAPLELPAAEIKAPKKVLIPQDFDKSSLIAAIHSAIGQSGLAGRKTRHDWLECHCPFHDDTEISAGFNIVSGVLNCMGACGRAFSPKELAAHFGIDWASYYPTKENRRKPTKPEIKAFQQSIEAIPTFTDSASYEDILRDEIMGRTIAYDAGQFVGFGEWKALPLGVLSATLRLGQTKNLALFLGKLQTALLAGEISSAYTESEAMRVTGFSRNCVSRCHLEAEYMGFVSFVRGINSIEIQPKVSIQNLGGRPASHYLVEFDASLIQNTLRKMLEIFYLEKHAKKAIAMPTMQLARQFGANAETLRDWQSRAKASLEDKDNKAAKRAFDTEMFGNGGNWKGWDNALNSKAYAPLDYGLYEGSQDLRAALLTWWVAKVRATNSREELCRLLGCTDPVIDKILDAANLASDKQHTRVELPKLPETVKAMQFEWSRIQRELQGKCWKGGFWDTTENAWIPFDDKDYLETYAKFAGKITKGYMLVQSPSRQRPMTDEEIAKRDEKHEAELLEKEAQVVTQVTVSKDNAVSETRAHSYQKWDKHSYAFMYRQLQLLVHCFTPYALEDHVIVDKKGNGIASGKLAELFAWLLENGAKTPVRKVKSFYGKGYDEERDLAALQALADERIKALGIKETWEFDDSPDSLPIFADMPKQAPMNFELNKPAPMLTPHGYIYGSPDNPEYFDYLNNPYVSAWEQANREAKVKQWQSELKGVAS